MADERYKPQERYTASTITDEVLDALYEELERLREIEWIYNDLCE